jgi:hypothetical protein
MKRQRLKLKHDTIRVLTIASGIVVGGARLWRFFGGLQKNRGG